MAEIPPPDLTHFEAAEEDTEIIDFDAVKAEKERRDTVHKQRARLTLKVPDSTDFKWPEKLNTMPDVLETCLLLKKLFQSFGVLNAARDSITTKSYYRRQNKLRRDLAPQLILGLTHLTFALADEPTQEIEDWMTNTVNHEVDRLLNYECVAALYLPYKRKAVIYEGETWTTVKEAAARRATFKALDLMRDTAEFPLGKAFPTFDSSGAYDWGWSRDGEQKGRVDFIRRSIKKLVRGLDQWKLVHRYCQARLANSTDAADSDMLKRIVDLDEVRRHIGQIEMLKLSVETEQLSL